jgi:hypothetical protein
MVTQEDVLSAVSRVAPIWESVARNLESDHLQEHRIEIIRRDAPNDVEKQAKLMLEHWRLKETRNVTVRHLCTAIVQAGRRADAEELFGSSLVLLCSQSESHV